MTERKSRKRITDTALMGLCLAVIIVSSWISIPIGPVPFTLQTMGICLVAGILGPVKGSLTVLIYTFLGLVGLPVFSNFKGGAAALLGPTGGYILGFILTALITGYVSGKTDKLVFLLISMFLGVTACYITGTVWFYYVYNKNSSIGFGQIISMCVLPFIIPDLVKIILASLITVRMKRLRILKAERN